MSVKYKYSGLTPELYQRLVSEHEALKQAHKKGSYKQFFQDVKQCDELQARIIYQAFNAAVVERARISPATVDRLEGVISDELFDDLQDYLSTNYTRGKTTKPVLNKTNAGLPEGYSAKSLITSSITMNGARDWTMRLIALFLNIGLGAKLDVIK